MSDSAAPPGARVRVRVVVRGRVQGVWFRGATLREAQRQSVDGWVRNRDDGSVEAVFEGAPEAVAALTTFARRGPPAARVEGVEEFIEAPRGERGFTQRRSED